MKIFYINLDKSINRNDHMIREFRKANVESYCRFPAIDGSMIDCDQLRRENIINSNNQPNTIACALSHISLWRKVATLKNEIVIIFEDDIILPKDFLTKFNEYYEDLPTDWDFVYLGGSRLMGKQVNEHILKAQHAKGFNGGFFAYMIKPETATKLLDLLEKTPLNTMIDLYFRDNTEDFNTYMFYPVLVEHDFSIESVRFKEGFYREQYLRNVKKHIVSGHV